MTKGVDVLRFRFEDFPSLPAVMNNKVTSDEVEDGNGHRYVTLEKSWMFQLTDTFAGQQIHLIQRCRWVLRLYPGGRDKTILNPVVVDPNDCVVWIFLAKRSRTSESVSLRFEIVVRNATGGIAINTHVRAMSEHRTYGVAVANRSDFLLKDKDILLNGALSIDVVMQYKTQISPAPAPTQGNFSQNLLKLLDNEDGFADVKFKVQGTVIPAHKMILKANGAIFLYGLCEGKRKGSVIPINDMTPDVFRILLRYIYGEEIPNNVTIMADSNCGKDIMNAADRYELVGLKLAIEVIVVEDINLCSISVADWLVYADAKNLALLKEYALQYFIARAADLMNTYHAEPLKESTKLIHEVILEILRATSNDARFGSTEMSMSVTELRRKLEEKGLDIDGSKEALVSRLRASKKRAREESKDDSEEEHD